jgi:adenine phosphoribosyltransferase
MKSELEKYIDTIEDFPIKGVKFKDIGPMLAFKFPELIFELEKLISDINFDLIIGIESRGFILGAALAQALGKGFVPVRKKGKLPPPTKSISYQLEYGQDTLEIRESEHFQGKKVLIVDDVIATGGTLKATSELCQLSELQVVGALALIDLTFLHENNLLKDITVKSLFEY